MAHEKIKIGYFEIYLVEIQKTLGKQCPFYYHKQKSLIIYNPKAMAWHGTGTCKIKMV